MSPAARVIPKQRLEDAAHTPNGSVIRAEGFGASQKLPGYDDGGNYDQNRRVEITLVVVDE